MGARCCISWLACGSRLPFGRPWRPSIRIETGEPWNRSERLLRLVVRCEGCHSLSIQGLILQIVVYHEWRILTSALGRIWRLVLNRRGVIDILSWRAEETVGETKGVAKAIVTCLLRGCGNVCIWRLRSCPGSGCWRVVYSWVGGYGGVKHSTPASRAALLPFKP